jgi:hypothetical protein
MNTEAVLESWAKFVEKRPKVDMNKCRKGTRMLSNKGRIFAYVRRDTDLVFPHLIMNEDGNIVSRTDEGWVYRNNPLPGDEDIVYIFSRK